MLIIRLLLTLVLSAIFIAYSWAHFQNVPDAAGYIALAVIGGVNFGLAIATVIVHFSRRL